MSTALSTPPPDTSAVPGPEPLPALLGLVLRAAERHVLVLVGDADLSTAVHLRQHVLNALAGRPPALLVDLSALDSCDRAGLDALHDGARLARAAGVPLSFRGTSPHLARLQATAPHAPAPLGRAQKQACPTAPSTQAGRADQGSTELSGLRQPADAARSDCDARSAEELVGRIADLVLKVSGLAARYEQAGLSDDPSGRTARLLALQRTAAQGRSRILSIAAPD